MRTSGPEHHRRRRGLEPRTSAGSMRAYVRLSWTWQCSLQLSYLRRCPALSLPTDELRRPPRGDTARTTRRRASAGCADRTCGATHSGATTARSPRRPTTSSGGTTRAEARARLPAGPGGTAGSRRARPTDPAVASSPPRHSRRPPGGRLIAPPRLAPQPRQGRALFRRLPLHAPLAPLATDLLEVLPRACVHAHGRYHSRAAWRKYSLSMLVEARPLHLA